LIRESGAASEGMLTSGQKWRIRERESHYFSWDRRRRLFGPAKRDGCGIAPGDRLAVFARALELARIAFAAIARASSWVSP
jgi:hypothetical protein